MNLFKKIMFAIIYVAIIAISMDLIKVRVPLVTGYLDLTDILVVLAGLFLGKYFGAVAAGVGSALGDYLTGSNFLVVTLFARGFEAYFAGGLGRKHPLWLILAGMSMVLIYFFYILISPQYEMKVAVTALPYLIIQGALGTIGGYLIFEGIGTIKLIFTKKNIKKR
jgi:uncharacterized membrane protein